VSWLKSWQFPPEHSYEGFDDETRIAICDRLVAEIENRKT
jgi:hypothetical protein